MATIAGFLIISISMLLQTSLFSQILLIQGAIDMVMIVVVSWSMINRVQNSWIWAIIAGLMMGFVSQIPISASIIAYLGIILVTRFLKQLIWQIPILALSIATVVSTLVLHFVSFTALFLEGSPIDPLQSLNLITLPTLLLNLVAVVPVNALVSEIANWIYPEEADEF